MRERRHRLLVAGLLLLALGAVFIVLENTFYQYVDDRGFLHESLFLPLGVFSVLLGVTCVAAHLLGVLWRRFR